MIDSDRQRGVAAAAAPQESARHERTHARRRPRWIVGAIVVLVLTVGAVTSLPGTRRALFDPAGRVPVTGVRDVAIRDDFWEYFAFTPAVVSVPVGAEITWTSTSRTEHNVVFVDGPSSPLLDGGQSWTQRFDTPADYRYVCTLHEGMNGRVVVTPARS